MMGISERRACRAIGQPRSTQRHKRKVPDDEERLTSQIVRLATQFGRYGYRRITALLRNEGWRVNHKRVERIWRREGLKVPHEEGRREADSRKKNGYPKIEYETDVWGLYPVGKKIWVATSAVDKAKGRLIDVFDRDGRFIDTFFLGSRGSLMAVGEGFIICQETKRRRNGHHC